MSYAYISFVHKRMAWGGHGLPKTSLGPAMPYPSSPSGWATPETALQPFQGWATCGRLLPLWTPHVVCPWFLSLVKQHLFFCSKDFLKKKI
jgi:hypothetical protein